MKHNFVKPCNCRRSVHAYCMTVQIIYDKKIFCKKCQSYYKLFVEQEKMCSGKLISVLVKFSMILFALLIFAAFFLIFDAFLKTEFAKNNPKVIEDYLKRQKLLTDTSLISLPATPDWREEFNIIYSIWWADLAAIGFLLSIL